MNNSLELFDAFRQGDQKAFCSLYKMYYNKLLRYGNIFSKDSGLVENVIQELFTRILKNPEKLNHVINIEAYLFKSVKQNVISEINREKKQTIIRKLIVDTNEKEASIEQQIINGEVDSIKAEWLKRQLELLPSHQKEILYLRFYEGLNYDEITKRTSVSNQVARNYVARALSSLREKDNCKY